MNTIRSVHAQPYTPDNGEDLSLTIVFGRPISNDETSVLQPISNDETSVLQKAEQFYQEEAERLAAAIFQSLPGGLVIALTGAFLRRAGERYRRVALDPQ